MTDTFTAFKWHPDRNHGREQEAATKFQDVSSAYEILIEPTIKAKYDLERAKVLRKNTTPLTSPGNPYNPYTNFPPARPPNARPDPNTNTGGGGAQYAQYTTQTNAPWSNANAQSRRAQAQDAWKAWDSMKNGGAAGGRPVPTYHPPFMRKQTNVPLQPRRPMPAASAPQARTGGPTSKVRAGWSEPEDQSKEPHRDHGPPGQGRPPGPGISRANTMRSPRRGGFDPGASQGDEPPARNTSAYYNMRASAGRGARPQSFVHPTAPLSADAPHLSRTDHPRVFRNVSSEENFGDRLSTPYATGGGEKTYFSSADLFRNPRPESAANLNSDGNRDGRNSRERDRQRHRSASPRMNSKGLESESSSDASSEDDGPLAPRSKLRPRSFRNRQPGPPPPPPPPPMSQAPPHNSGRPATPGLTVENEFGKVHEFSKPIKRSTWNNETGQTQAQRLAEEMNGARRTSTGNIPAQHSPQPSPLHTATNAASDASFEPLEKSTSWQQQYGSPTDTTSRRHFEPPVGDSKPRKYVNISSYTIDLIDIANTASQSSVANPLEDSTDSASPSNSNGSYFQSQNWQEKFSNSGHNLFSPQDVTRNGSPTKGKGSGNLKVPRKASLTRKQNAPRPTKGGSDADSVPSMSSSTESISSGNAMDIDAKTPPTKSGTTATIGHADSIDHLNMKDLQSTAPFTPSNNSGLGDLNDLGATLPFDSQAASTLPPEGINMHKLQLPHPPKAPSVPNISALRSQDWEHYLLFIKGYMAEWNMFSAKMLKHFNARQWAVENDLPKGWLEAVGEGGLSNYLCWLEEDTRVRQHWEVSIEKHTKAMKDFQSVKKVASTCKFVSH